MKCKYIDSSLLMISEKGLEQMQLYPENTLLLVTRSGILRHTIPVAILKKPATINQDLKAIMLYTPNLEEYIYICIKGMESRLILEYTKAGATVENINFDAFQKILLPIPPENQIQRIIDATNDTDEVIGKLKIEQEDLIDIIDKTKSKILDLAIRGKLVPQNPDDEPASVLLERIRAEKEELIRQGKIKRDKKESVIFKGEDNSYYLNDGSTDINITSELPFNIPASWRWAQINNVLIVNPRNKLDDELEVSFVPMPLINDGYSGKHTAEVRKWKDIKTGFTHFSEGDVGVAKISPCFENLKSTVFENLSNGYGAGTTELYILRPYKDTILARYLLMYIKSDYFIRNGKQTCTGDVGQQRVRKDYVESAYFPIPPLNEQHRIVEAIETAFSQLDAIAESLN